MSECKATRHGTRGAYWRHGCRCPDAREQVRLYYKRRREGRLPVARVSPLGSKRRLEALASLGYPLTVIAETMCQSGSTAGIRSILRGQKKYTLASTAEEIKRVYDKYSMTPYVGPRPSKWTGVFPPPLAWDDEDLDNPDAIPQWTPIDKGRVAAKGRRAQALSLLATGHSVEWVAAQCEVTPRTVWRYLKEQP